MASDEESKPAAAAGTPATAGGPESPAAATAPNGEPGPARSARSATPPSPRSQPRAEAKARVPDSEEPKARAADSQDGDRIGGEKGKGPAGPSSGSSSSSSSFYGYMYADDKTPTKTLDALLRAIGQYIVSDVAVRCHCRPMYMRGC